VRLEHIASGYCFRATSLIAPYVGELMGEKPARYSRALLETLAIIAYRQPITRGEIEQIRGVAVSGHILKTLQEREWIKSVGHKEVPGKPELLATTKNFLDYFHLHALSDLPELAELVEQDPAAAEKALEEQLMISNTAESAESTSLDSSNAPEEDSENSAMAENVIDEEDNENPQDFADATSDENEDLENTENFADTENYASTEYFANVENSASADAEDDEDSANPENTEHVDPRS
jgi:segregation and condensation protein B